MIASSLLSPGGFALNAAAGGAIECTGVDSSASAVSLAKANAELNGLADRARFVCSDIEKFMAQALSDGLTWDVVILDPPKLAPSKGTLPKAERKYAKLNRSAAKLVAPGGILMTCSCSGDWWLMGDTALSQCRF